MKYPINERRRHRRRLRDRLQERSVAGPSVLWIIIAALVLLIISEFFFQTVSHPTPEEIWGDPEWP